MVTVVTGASGMLGSSLVSRLVADGYDVTGVDLRGPAATDADGGPPRYRHVVADVRDATAVRAALAGADALIHCAAALPSYPADQIRSVIVDGTRTVMDAAAAAGVGRVIHVSSTAVYGLPERVPTGEDHPYAPVDVYSRAKADAERLALEHRGDGRVLTVLRPKTFLGPGRMGLFSMLFEWADEGRNFPVLGDGRVRIQMLHITDLVEAVLTALTAPAGVADDTYNVGAVEFGTLRDDFQAVLDAAGHGRRVVTLPAGPALAVLGLLQRTRMSPVYGRLLRKLTADSYVDTSRLRERLGFTPRYSNRDAVLDTYRWWREQPDRRRSTAGGRTSREPWRQGALGFVRIFF